MQQLPESKFITTELLDEILAQEKDAWTQKYINEGKRTAVVILVLDPSKPLGISPEPVKLWSATLGQQDREQWPKNRNWDKYVFAKARAAWRTCMSNHNMLMNPEIIAKGDFKYEGGIYVSGGLVIAVSGLAKAPDDTGLASEFHFKITSKVSALQEKSKEEVDLENDGTFFF
ncbi:MAG: hypothetical protein V4524_02040 [Patescibacteria group bacterium]